MKKIFVLGSLNMDLVMACARIPAEGETLSGSGFFTNPGGKGANQAYAAARLGGKTFFCGCVGDDVFGSSLTENLKRAFVDISGVRVCKNTNTGIAVVLVSNGNNRILLDAGANGEVTVQDAENFLRNAETGDLLLAQAEIPTETLHGVFLYARRKGMKIIFNPAPAKTELNKLCGMCDLVLPNETELEILSGERDVERGTELLSEYGADVIVTLGGKGCYFLPHGGEGRYFPCPKVQVVDTTAAGDTFCGALSVRLAEGAEMTESVRFALRAASLSVTKKGAQSSVPCRKEADEAEMIFK